VSVCRTYHSLERSNAVLEVGGLEPTSAKHGQDLPAGVVETQLLDTMLTAVPVAVVNVADVVDELTEPEVKDAAVWARDAPVLTQHLHDVARRHALVEEDLEGAEVEALHLDGRGDFAEEIHLAPGGIVALNGAGTSGAALGRAVMEPDLWENMEGGIATGRGATWDEIGRVEATANAAVEALNEDLAEGVDEG
jgi:hypothetical protein